MARSFKKFVLFIFLYVLIFGLANQPRVWADDFTNLPPKGMVTMIDIGAKKCIPCKMMAPILEKLEKQYKGKAVIAFIDVWQNTEQGKRFHIRGIPTQLFFDKNGNEIYRHVGFFSEQDIVAQLKKMGVEPPPLDKET